MADSEATINRSERVLVYAPERRTADAILRMLRQGEIDGTAFVTVTELFEAISRGAADAIVLSQQALNPENTDRITHLLHQQPPWSDLPIVIITPQQEPTETRKRRLNDLEERVNAVVIQRPISTVTLISTLRAVLRARRQQYRLRELAAERERNAVALQESNERLNIALDTARLGAWDFDLATNQIECAPRCKANFGYDVSENFSHDKWMASIHPDDRAGVVSAMQTAIERGQNYHVTFRSVWPDGSLHWIISSGRIIEQQGQPARMVGVTMDITEQKRGEEALRESERYFRTVAESLPQLVWASKPNGEVEYLNSQWVAFTGIPEKDQLGFRWLDLVIHPDDCERTCREWLAAVGGREFYDIEHRLRRHDGVYRWFKTRALPSRDQAGKIVRWFGSSTDITDLRETREALRESEERFRTMANSAPVMIWTSSIDMQTNWFNEPWLRFTGCRLEQKFGLGWYELVHPEDREQCLSTYQSSFDKREPFVMDYRLRRYDGEWRWVVDHGLPRFSSTGEFLGYIGSCIDITDRRRVEEALRATNRELEEFAYVASHDLQEPLRTINIYTQLLLRRYGNSDDAEEQLFAKFIRDAVVRMGVLLKDLLAYSRIIHSEPVERQSADLNRALEQAIETMSTRIRESGAILNFGPLPTVKGEESQIVQVFQNLLSNSIKYAKAAEPPRINISAQLDKGCWVVSFEDNGIGFDQEFAERIFGLFKRLHRDAYPGTGLGLAICKRIIERNGGRMWAEAERGRGATFRFSLPVLEEEIHADSAGRG